MIPFLESAGGSCQFAVILVEVAAVTLKLSGDCEGTRNDKTEQTKIMIRYSIYFIARKNKNFKMISKKN